MQIDFQPERVGKTLACCVLTLTALHGVGLVLYFNVESWDVWSLVRVFDFDTESNVPTLYSAMQLLLCSAFLWWAGRLPESAEDGRRKYWYGLSLVFAYLAIDEGGKVHENLGDAFETLEWVDARGYLYFMWVVPYGAVFAVLGLIYLRFVWRLPSPTRSLVVIAGVMFLTGALGVEMISAREAEINSTESVTYCLLYTLEEHLEMMGVTLFIYAVLSYVAERAGVVTLRLVAASPPS